ncbi:MAG: amino acid permease [Firmicutes bacterium HGW-Firmicutes-16]|nr:MAG: amino acid permease [Firmicutes bacterium HGW-Firmicutes-16]
MDSKLREKYGLPVAIAMVVGIVIGSGVFFKAEKILNVTGGDQKLGILAWLIGGAIMVVCAYTFAIMATRYSYVNGLVDYAEVTCGSKYAYLLGWFMSTIYYPTLTSVLAWVSARFTCVLLGWDITGGSCLAIAAFYMCASYAINALSPVLAGKFQVTATVIKVVPLLLMGVVGLIVGLTNGLTVQNFTNVVAPVTSTGKALFTAVVATAFAYEGWIIATSINAELKDAKKNLPKALTIGTIAVIIIYILYYVGLTGGVTNEVMMKGGQDGAKIAFETIFSKAGGTLLFVFVIISCLGTLNGLMLGNTRGMYSLAVRNEGPKPEMFKQVDPITNMPTNSSILGLFLCGFWLLYFYGANLVEVPWFGKFSFDTSELPIVTIYFSYIPIFIAMMIKEKELSAFKRIIMPFLAICGCVFMVFAACYTYKFTVLYYLAIFAVIMLIGVFFIKKKETVK